jgi:oligosaccharide repeat unit polymerase
MAALAAVAIGLGTAVAATALDMADPSPITLIAAGALAAVLVLAVRRLARNDWFHPLAFPLVYVGVALMGPVLYIVLSGQGLTDARPGDVTTKLVVVFVLIITGLAVGILLALAWFRRADSTRGEPLDQEGLASFGRTVLGAATFFQLWILSTSYGARYGTAQTTFGAVQAVDNLTTVLAFVGTALLVSANAARRGRLGTPNDYALFALFVMATFLAGRRGELVAPALFALWVYHTRLRPIRIGVAMLMTLAVVVLFQGVSGARLGTSFYEGGGVALNRTASSLGTPIFITSKLIQRVPVPVPYSHGETYLAALERQLPSPVAIALFGPPTNTGAFRFRQIINYGDPNSGFGFSLPSEAYLNFGLGGALLIAGFVGLLFGYAYRRHDPDPTRGLDYLYPILLATLPLGLRSDALTEIKMVAYPMIAIVVLIHFSRPRTSRA